MKESIKIEICKLINKIEPLMWFLAKFKVEWYIWIKACLGSRHWKGVDKDKWLKEIRSD